MIQSSDIWQQLQGDIHSIGKDELLVEKWSIEFEVKANLGID